MVDVPAGWFPDEQYPRRFAFWDGTQWELPSELLVTPKLTAKQREKLQSLPEMNGVPGWYRDPLSQGLRYWHGEHWTEQVVLSGPAARSGLSVVVTTLDYIPGARIVRIAGMVATLGASSGFTATAKGNVALDATFNRLREQAAELYANAVLGVTGGPFGAGGGITSFFGGDAVGVLLLGTAVVIEWDPSEA